MAVRTLGRLQRIASDRIACCRHVGLLARAVYSDTGTFYGSSTVNSLQSATAAAAHQAEVATAAAAATAAYSDYLPAAVQAIEAAAAANKAAGFPTYDERMEQDGYDAGVLISVVVSRFRFVHRGRYIGHRLLSEPAGTVCRLTGIKQNFPVLSVLKTIITAARTVIDPSSCNDSSSSNDGSSGDGSSSSSSSGHDRNIVVFQPMQLYKNADDMKQEAKESDRKKSVYNLDIFKVPAVLFAASPEVAHDQQHIIHLPGKQDESSGAAANSVVKQQVLAAVQQGTTAGPYHAESKHALYQLMRGLTAARRELYKLSASESTSSSSSSSSSSGGGGSNGVSCMQDFFCTVSIAGHMQQPQSSPPSSSSSKLGHPLIVTVYPCQKWPLVPREHRVAAIAAAAAAGGAAAAA